MKFLITLLNFTVITGFAQEMHYPELEVTPRATERIKIEAKREAGDAWISNIPVQLSGLMTFAAGAMSTNSIKDDKPEGDMAPTVAMGVGALWLGASVWATTSYRPYLNTYKKIKKFPYKSNRQKLVAERMAEEELKRLARLGRNIRYLSVLTNLAASGYLLENVEGESDAQMVAGFSALAAITPLFFKYSWERINCEQNKYKKKIYSSVVMSPLIKRAKNGSFSSGISLALQF